MAMSLYFKFFISLIYILLIYGKSSSIAQIKLDSSIVACYSFSGNAGDSSGNSHHGSVYGPILTNDRYGNPNSAYLFDGVDDFISVSHHSDFNFNTNDEFAISVWIKPNSNQGIYFGGSNDIISKWVDNSNANEDFPFAIRIYNHTISREGKVAGLRYARACGEYPNVESFSSLFDNKFHHIVFMRSIDDSLRLFIDGTLNSVSKDLTTCNTVNGTEILFGRRTGGKNPAFYSGVIDDIRIYSRDLKIDEVNELFTGNFTCDVEQNSNNPTPCRLNAMFKYSESCLNDTTFFADLSEDKTNKIISWNWDFGDGNSSIGPNSYHRYNAAGLYQVILNIKNDSVIPCYDSDTQYVRIYTMPLVKLNDDTIICIGDKYIITLDSASGNFIWNDSSISNEKIIKSKGEYWVKLNNPCGVSSDTIKIGDKLCHCNVYYPNTFTPNNDGINDNFEIKTTCKILDFNIQIYSRWGKLIFESFDENFIWNGIVKSQTPQDVYHVKIKVVFKEGLRTYNIEKFDIITVIR